MKRYALLDTDFISKTHSVQDDGGNHLIDQVMELPGYEFFCHAQIVTELNRYNADAPIWLSEKIGAQKIKRYTDARKMTERLFRKAGLWYTGATDESKMKAQSGTASAILDAGGFLFGGIMVQ